MANEVQAQKNAGLPAHLQERSNARIGNVDSSDRIIPRIKLMQGISPELQQYNAAKAGEFFHTMSETSLGSVVRVVPIRVHKSLVLWAPRGDERGILARSDDGRTWTTGANETFEVKLKGSPKKQVWETKGSVAESGLAEFGSSIAEDKNSPPAAALTYSWIFLPIDHPELGVGVVINSRSAVKPSRDLISKIELNNVMHYYRVFDMRAVEQVANGDKFNNYQYTSNGFVEDPDMAAHCKQLAAEFEKMAFRASDESEDSEERGSGGGERGKTDEKMASKF